MDIQQEKRTYENGQWQWFFTGTCRDECSRGDIWMYSTIMGDMLKDIEPDSRVMFWVCEHGKGPHVHGVLNTTVGQAKLKKLWGAGLTHFIKFQNDLRDDLFRYVQTQRVGPVITERCSDEI